MLYRRGSTRPIPVRRHFSDVATSFVRRSCFGQAHDHLYDVLVSLDSEQLAGETMVPDNVISRCQIQKHATGLSLSQLNCLIHD